MQGGIAKGWRLVGLAALLVGAGLAATATQGQEAKVDDAALKRTRKQVQILDDIYKSAIVIITEHYVDETSDLAAGAAFQKLFDAVKQKGYHEVRLLDATGEPYEAKNSPKDDFEKQAVAALKAGKPSPEKIVEMNGKQFLRVATPIPVVMKKCTLCHPAYEKATAGQPIGALGYTIPIE
jgi:hypothetical protein